jgi:hypothetical protein
MAKRLMNATTIIYSGSRRRRFLSTPTCLRSPMLRIHFSIAA